MQTLISKISMQLARTPSIKFIGSRAHLQPVSKIESTPVTPPTTSQTPPLPSARPTAPLTGHPLAPPSIRGPKL